MSLLDVAISGPYSRNKCWAEELSDDKKAELAEVHAWQDAGKDFNRSAVARALNLDPSRVARHFRRECTCPR